MVRSFVFVSILTMTALVGFAPVMAARPFATDDAGTVEAGKFELETTCNYWEKKQNLVQVSNTVSRKEWISAYALVIVCCPQTNKHLQVRLLV